MRASQYIKALADGAKIHPNELLGGFGTPGNIYFVIPSTETYYEVLKRDWDFVYNDGSHAVQTSLETAYGLCVAGRNDLILLYGNATHTLSAMLTMGTSRVNVLGYDPGYGRMTQQAAKIQLGVTTDTDDIAAVKITANRNSLRNVKIINANTLNECLTALIDNGEGTLLENVHAVKTAGLDDSGHAHFWMAGDSLTALNCTFGQSNLPNTAAGYGIKIDGLMGGATDGTVKENYLKNILVKMSVGGSVQATSAFIKIVDNSALNFDNVIDGIIGSNYMPSGGTVMTDAILGAASTVAGALNIKDAAWFGCTGVGAGAGYGVNFASGGVAGVAAGGLSAVATD